MTGTRRPGCAPRPLRRPCRRPARRPTEAEAWDAAGVALALIANTHTGAGASQAEILAGQPRGLVLETMTYLATAFLHVAVCGGPADGAERAEVVTGVLRNLGLVAMERATR